MRTIEILINGERTVLEAGRSVTIGRGEAADLKLDDPRVSRIHATVRDVGGQWVLEDSSSGGTWNNGNRVSHFPITRESRLRLGSVGAPEIILKPEGAVSGPDANATIAVSPAEVAAARQPLSPPPVSLPNADSTASGPPRIVSQPDAVQPPFIPAETGSGSSRGVLVGLAAIAALILIGGGIFFVQRDGDGETEVATEPVPTSSTIRSTEGSTEVEPVELTPAEMLTQAKLATVQFLVVADGNVSTGSGAFISEDLILTNLHVVENATDIQIAGTTEEDTPAEFRYEGRIEAVHPFLDLAIVRVTGTSDLSDLTLSELQPPEPLSVGDSAAIRAGDSITVLGFPGITGRLTVSEMGEFSLPIASVTRGEVVTFNRWPGCDDPNAADWLIPGGQSRCAPDGDLPRGNVISDDLSGSGGSGGPVIIDGEIVAVRYAVGTAQDPLTSGSASTGGRALSIGSEYFMDWVDEVIAS